MTHFCDDVVAVDVWILDNGCSNYVLDTKSLFKELDESQNLEVRSRDNK